MGAGEWIAMAAASAAFLAVAGQLRSLAREHELTRRRARYHELEVLYSELGAAIGRSIGRLRLAAVTGEIDAEGALLEDGGKLRDGVMRVRMHQAPEHVRKAVLACAGAHDELTGRDTGGWKPKRATDPAFQKLEDLLADYYDAAGDHLREVWPRPKGLP